jgi:sialic acid synthase SpsE
LFSTPFDFTAVDFLEKMNVPAYKIASFELVDLPLISRAAATGKPMILSTGMATFEEIEEAVATVRGVGNDQIILLKCTSDYPASPEHMNLRTIPDLAERLQVIVGLSDHSMVPEPVVAAVALGANVIEKHLTLRRSDGGPDAGFSLEPEEFRKMVDSVRATEQSLGKIRYEPTEREEGCRRLRKSLFAVRDIASGDVITEENLRSIRPGNGLHTRHYREIVGNWRAKTLISKGTPMAWELIEKIP